MAVGEYLKVAASQLRRAAEASKKETDDIRAQIAFREREINKAITDIRNNIQRVRQNMINVDNPNGQVTNISAIGLLEKQIHNITNEFEQEKQQLLQTFQNKEQLVVNLNSQATEMEKQASNV